MTGAGGLYGTIGYTYDNVGNRLIRTIDGQTETYSYVPGTNRLDQVSGTGVPVNYSYDANGNIVAMGAKTLIYNQNNRRVRVEDNTNILGEYTYNGLGQRVIETAGGVTTIFHYDFDGNLIAESAPDGTFNVEYLYVDQARMAMVDVGSGKAYYFLNNYLGTPVLMTDDTNTIVWEADYRPFGEAKVNQNSEVVNNFRFAGQYYDDEIGLHYNYHRYYDPKTGRYLTPDPIGLLGGINLYSYVQNDPVNWIDPWGFLQRDIDTVMNLLHRYYPDSHIPPNVKADINKPPSELAGQYYLLTDTIRLHKMFLEPLNDRLAAELLRLVLHEWIHANDPCLKQLLDTIFRDHPDVDLAAEEIMKDLLQPFLKERGNTTP